MIRGWLSLIGYFVVELIVSALKVAWLVVQPRIRLRPAIIDYPLTVTSDAQITLLANLITLTPGTLSLDVSDDRRTLKVHAIDIDSPERLIGHIAAGLETRVMRALR